MQKLIYISSCMPEGGVAVYGFDGDRLEKRGFMHIGRAMYTALDGDTLHCVAMEADSLRSFAASARIDIPGASFGSRIPLGLESCFIDARGGDFYTADYSSSSITKNGTVTVTHEGCGTDPERQEAAHPHQSLITPDGRFVAVCDLGFDRVFVYDRDLNEISHADVPHGHGVRHLVFAPDGRRAFSINELACSITEFEFDNGNITALRTIPPRRCRVKSYGGAIRISPDGKLLFASVRGDNVICVYSVTPDGTVPLREFGCGGDFPRDFALCGDRLIIANERSGNICVTDLYGRKISGTELPAPLCVTVREA